MLSKLAFALRDPRFKEVITRHGSREEILAEAHRIEENLRHFTPNPQMVTWKI
jgi:hypothetical protein